MTITECRNCGGELRRGAAGWYHVARVACFPQPLVYPGGGVMEDLRLRAEWLATWDTMSDAEKCLWIAENVMGWGWCRVDVEDGDRFALYSPGRAEKDYLPEDRKQARPEAINWSNPPWETPAGAGFIGQRIPKFNSDAGAGVAVRDMMAKRRLSMRSAFLANVQEAVTHRLGLKNGRASYDEVALRATAADWCEAAYMATQFHLLIKSQ